AIELAGRAWGYVAWTAAIDPWTLAVIGGGLVAAGWARDRLPVALAAGVALHLGWLVHVGGDFMGGRWFVAPVWVAAAILARLPWSRAACWAAIAASGLSLASPYAPLRSTRGYVKAPAAHGVVDERGYYWAGTGAWTGSTIASGPIHPFAADGRRARSRPAAIKSVIGLYGFAAGPSHHVIDRLGLADPLLARLPAELDPGFRIGHFRRKVPDGYVASVIAGDDQLRDPDVRALYGAIRLVTRGPLWTVDRWVAIGRLAVGGYPVDRVRWRYPDVQWLVDGQGPVDVGPTGAGIVVTGVSGALRVDGTGPWTVYVERGDRIVDRRIEPGTFTVALGGLDRVVWVSDGPSRVARVTVAATGAGG
ncbi:MAG: hypothetical protein ABMB14_26860, partial [Myxococcota bacterium]